MTLKSELFCDEGAALFRLAGAFKPHAENQTLGGYLNCQLHLYDIQKRPCQAKMKPLDSFNINVLKLS